jgi:amino acid adenylation domain-containing protein
MNRSVPKSTVQESGVDSTHTPLQDVLPSDAEREGILRAWNATEQCCRNDRCVHTLVEAQAARTPDAVAVSCGAAQLTYGELNRRANQLARYLRGLRVEPEAVVGICIEHSPQSLIAILGVLKAGAAYLPIDPAYPIERRQFMLEDAGAQILLTAATDDRRSTTTPSDKVTRRQADKLTETVEASTPSPFHPLTLSEQSVVGGQWSVVDLNADWPSIELQPDGDLEGTAALDNLAYIIYTSGSTGLPKGVEIEHRSLLNLVFWHRRAFEVSEQSRATLLAAPGFDASVWELWPYLTAGAQLRIPDQETRIISEQLRDWIVAESITISFLPTPLAERMLALEWPEHTALRSMLTGGDTLHHYPSHQCFALVNNYGPTEATVVATSGVVPPRQQDSAPSIGRPIDNMQAYVLDEHMQPARLGEPGELYLGGIQLARGYHQRPDLTAERFVPNPFTENQEPRTKNQEPRTENQEPISMAVGGRWSVVGGRLYRTGDLARYRPDGTIEFLGRGDQQVKLRGFRIELGEIAAVLSQHPAVRSTVVVACEDRPGDKRLVAYVVPAQEQRTKPVLSEFEGNKEQNGEQGDSQFSILNSQFLDELRVFLREKLPEYMIPAAFVLLEGLPLTPNGKVDRKALPAPDWTKVDRTRAFVEPHTPLEEVLASMWSDALEIPQISSDDNFFELGGHSLRATQIVSRVQKTFQLNLTIRDLFAAPTVAELAQHLIAHEQQAGRIDKIAIALKRVWSMSPQERQRVLQQKKAK